MPGAKDEGTAGVAINQAADTPTFRQSGSSNEVIQQTGSGLGGALNRVVGEGCSEEWTAESSVMGRCQSLQDLWGENLNNAVSGGTIIIIKIPLSQM